MTPISCRTGRDQVSRDSGISGTVTLEAAASLAQSVTLDFRPVAGGEAFSRGVTLSPSGAFEVTLVPAGVYDIALKGSKWLRSVVRVNAALGSFAGVNVLLKAGDANDNNSVDVLDLDSLIQAFDSDVNSAHWNTGADCNGDGSVDVLDLDLILRNFDAQGDP
jgi:hypothetical protein